MYVDSCSTGAGTLCQQQAYHLTYPQHILDKKPPICHLDALNCVIALKQWAHHLTHSKVVIHCDSATAVAVMQAGKGRDSYIQACAREIWLVAAMHHISLSVVHISGQQLTLTADALSRYHTAPKYREKVNNLIKQQHLAIVHPPPTSFLLSPIL
jgi:hypothetical protein